MNTGMQPDPKPGRPAHDIAMWGAPGSGKTTLLAALDIALMRKDDDWRIVGSDPASSEFLIERTNALSTGKVFPEASQGLEHYHWTLYGPGERHRRRWWRRPGKPEPFEVGVGMIDAPGGLFSAGPRRLDYGPDVLDDLRERMLNDLVKSLGIVFLFDPIREFERGDAFDHLHPPLKRLTERMRDLGRLTGGRLPHHVAVCVTKFDDPRVLETAEKMHLLAAEPDDPYGFPRVSHDDARDLFRQLCDLSANGNADMVLNALGRYFHPDRVRFFVTSSIGFYVHPQTKAFDWHDYQNLLPEDDDLRIRGPIHPINVVEPMLWLGRRLAAEKESPR
ncbi:hypothetical protein [Microbispora triticiradicis]|uniref:hypothetical protein n=1 Tax=Microbispora triticiradicis TaxID=2200763 RepID=UPI0027DE9E1B|nr:hypothetical protein [Microbispora triticiradicis]